MGKLALGPILRGLVILLIGFFVARHQLSEDVARKLYAGETVELWGGAWTISIKQIVDFLLASWPAIVPIAFGIWTRFKSKLRERIALWMPAGSTEKEVKALVAETPVLTRVAAVLTSDPAKIDPTASI